MRILLIPDSARYKGSTAVPESDMSKYDYKSVFFDDFCAKILDTCLATQTIKIVLPPGIKFFKSENIGHFNTEHRNLFYAQECRKKF